MTKPLLLALLVLAVAGCGTDERRVAQQRRQDRLDSLFAAGRVSRDSAYAIIDHSLSIINGALDRAERLAADSARCANASTTRKYFDGALTCRWVLDTADFADTIRGNWVKYRNSSTKKIHLVGPQLWEIIRVRVDSIYVCDTARKGE